MSERLLKINKDGLPECTYCKYPEYQGQCNECEMHGDVAVKLCEYEQAEADGLMVRLPCKVGDTVYVISLKCSRPIDCNADCEYCTNNGYGIEKTDFILSMLDDFGKTVFLTREEAEQALKELEAQT